MAESGSIPLAGASVGQRLTFSTSVSQRDIALARELLDPKGYRIAMQAGISRTQTTQRAQVARRIAKVLTVKVGDAREQISLKRPSLERLEGMIRLSRKPVPMMDLAARQTRRGVTVKPWRNQPRQLLRGAFIARMASGHEGVFERTNLPGRKDYRETRRKKRDDKQWTELPIVERFGPTIVGWMAGAPGVLSEVVNETDDVLGKNILSQIDRVLARKGLSRLLPVTPGTPA